MRINLLVTRILEFLFTLVGAFLLLRFVLKLFGANEDNGFVSWWYEMSGVLLDPFRGVFPTETYQSQYVLEFSTLFALLVYGLAYLLIVALINAITPTPADEARRSAL
ncbi:YggT family protein [Demequina sp.]|uniref:YggT family protein n=1 Tax=Demequina sp. TaxID=2050685 RepID=UPI0025C5AEC6|nr:YggT family protein [Demequina sp.]